MPKYVVSDKLHPTFYISHQPKDKRNVIPAVTHSIEAASAAAVPKIWFTQLHMGRPHVA